MIYSQNNESGFMALISAIVMSLILITITVILNLTGFFGRYNILDAEYKETSKGLAEACVDTAILGITQGNIPLPNTVITVGPNQCTIVSVTGASPAIIKTQAIFKKSYTNLKVSYSPSTFSINSWEECANACP